MAGSLRGNRDFLLLWAGEAVSDLGSMMTTLVVPIIGYAVTGSTTLAGLVGTVALLAGLATRLPAGALADRWPRDRTLRCANLGRAAVWASVAVAQVAGDLTLVHLMLAAALAAVGDSFAAPAMAATVRTVVTPEQRPVAYSRIEARGHAASLVGPPLGGAMYSLARWVPFVADTVSFLVSALTVSRLRTPLPPPAASRGSVRSDVAAGLRFLWRTPTVRALMAWGAIVNLGGGVAFVGVTLRLVRAGVHPAAIGLVDTVASVAGLLGALLAPRVIGRVPTSRLTLVTALAIGAAFAATAATTSPWGIGALLAAGVFLLPANNAGISAYLAHVVPDAMQGRMNSAAGFVAGGLAPAGPVLAGAVLAAFGGVATALLTGALVAASVVPLLLSRETMAIGRPEEWPAGEVTGSRATPAR